MDEDVKFIDPPLTCQQCFNCVHLQDYNKMTCKAFPKGIPEDILSRRHNHREPYEGDHGILFEEEPDDDE